MSWTEISRSLTLYFVGRRSPSFILLSLLTSTTDPSREQLVKVYLQSNEDMKRMITISQREG